MGSMKKESISFLFKAGFLIWRGGEERDERLVPAVRFFPHFFFEMFSYQILYKYLNQVYQGLLYNAASNNTTTISIQTPI